MNSVLKIRVSIADALADFRDSGQRGEVALDLPPDAVRNVAQALELIRELLKLI